RGEVHGQRHRQPRQRLRADPRLGPVRAQTPVVMPAALTMPLTEIPRAEVEHHPLSYADPSGRLFSWRGDLYRGVYADRAPFYRELFASGVAAALIEKGLMIAAEPADLCADGFGLILKCQRVPFVSYP